VAPPRVVRAAAAGARTGGGRCGGRPARRVAVKESGASAFTDLQCENGV